MTVFEGRLLRDGLRTSPGEIILPFRRFSTGADKPALFFLGGGPGVSNLKYTPPPELVAAFDVVVLEYRGVGDSSIKLNSPYFDRALRQLYGALSLEHAEGMRSLYAKAFKDLKSQGIVFDEFSVKALANDVEMLRKQLGYEQIHIMAHSFGTRIALRYQSEHRERVAKSVLFALNVPGGFIWYPDQTMAVWRRYQQALLEKNYNSAMQLQQLLDNPKPWPDSWLGIPIDPARALFGAFMLSFHRHTAVHALNTLLGAQWDHNFKWFLLDKSYGSFIRFGFNWADLFVKAYSADCNPDWILQADKQGRNSVFQSPSSALFAGYREYADVSGHCQADLFELDFQDTLVVSGEFDPSTPLERIPKDLPAAQHVILPNQGHGDIFYRDLTASTYLVMQYLLHAKVDTSYYAHLPLFEPDYFEP